MPVLFPSFVRDAGTRSAGVCDVWGSRAPHLEEEWRSYVALTEPGNRHAFVRTLHSVVDPAGSR